jgi:subtilase family serine protease
MVRLPGHVLPALSKATVIPSRSDACSQRITLTLVLKLDDEAGFKQYLNEIYDPTSPNFQNFLDANEISRRFGPSRESYEAVHAYPKEHGFKLIQGSADYATISVEGRRSDAEQAFAVKFGDYQIGKRKFYANQADPALPGFLASHVQAVIGFNDFAQPSHTHQSAPRGAFTTLRWSLFSASVGRPSYYCLHCR